MPFPWKGKFPHRSRKKGENSKHSESIPTQPTKRDSEIPVETKTTSTPATGAPPQASRQIDLLSDPCHLWHEAHDLLREKDAKLVDAYKTSLLQEADIEPSDGFPETEINDRLKAIIEIRLEEIQNSRVKITIAGRDVDLKKSVRRSIETVLSVKDLVTTAVNSEFHASLAWAGALILLNPIAKAVKQSDDATEGFAKISDLLAQYKVIEGFQVDDDLSENPASIANKNLRGCLRENVVKLYAAILDYHIRLAKHFSRSGFFRVLEDLGGTDDWRSMLETVTNLHDSISEILRTIRHDMLQGVDNKLGELKRELGESRRDIEEIKHSTKSTNQEQLLKRLNAAQLAAFNAQFRHETGDVCLKDTQLQILRDIREWCDGPDREAAYLLKGMAGTGKSTISRTLATACQDRQPLVDGLPLSNSTVLGGSFFFKERIHDQNHGGKFFVTICQHLADSIPDFREEVCETIQTHPNIGTERMEKQWKLLILNPLKKLGNTVILPLNLIVVVDALDECRAESDLPEIFRLLSGTRDLSSIRFRFFFTSRPEVHVGKFLSQFFQGRFVERNLEKVTMAADELASGLKNDITLFLEHELLAISRYHGFGDKWPGELQIQDLAHKSDGLFIFAATACRFLAGPRVRSDEVKRRLSKILADGIEGESPQQILDSMYCKILQHTLLEDALEDEKVSRCNFFREVVGSIVTLFDPLSTIALSNLLSKQSDGILENLEALSSVLSIGKGEDSTIQLLHLSFRDFLLDQSRCGRELWISQVDAHAALLNHCLNTLSASLKKNICQLPDPSTFKADIDAGEVARYIPSHVQYACLFWVPHLLNCNQDASCDNSEVYTFLEKHFLHWIEALSLMGRLGDGVKACVQVSDYVSSAPPQGGARLRELVYDMKRFILTFNHILQNAPLQVYVSALLFSPKGSLIWRLFQFHISDKITRLPMPAVDSEESWSAVSQTLLDRKYERKYKAIEDLAFSPDGNLVASSSVCVWDIRTGTLLRTFEPLGYGSAVSFSPSGDCVISISSRGEVRVWNIQSGSLEYEARVEETDFSNLQSFSYDGIFAVMKLTFLRIRLVDIAAKKILMTFEPHSKEVTDIAISHDGKLLATSSLDRTVRLWSVDSGKLQEELRCDDIVHFVKFSVDSSQVVLMSRRRNFKVWSTSSGGLLKTIDGDFRDAKFASNGKLLITSIKRSDPSISDSPLSILIWDAKSYKLLRTLPAPFEDFQVSPDGKYLIKTPHDQRNRSATSPVPPVRSLEIWNLWTGELHSTIQNHSSAIVKASFSMDGTLIGCACQDGTVRLWDLVSKQQSNDSELSGMKIEEIGAFSQDYATVNTESGIGLWNLETGCLHRENCGEPLRNIWGTPLLGHINSGGPYFATRTRKEVKIWSSRTGDVAARLTYRASDIAALKFSQSEVLLAVAFEHRDPLWRFSEDEESSLIDRGHTHVEKSADFDDENWDCVLFVPELTLDSHVQIWNLNTREKLPVIVVELKDILAVSLSANGAFVALLVSPSLPPSHKDSRIRELQVWDIMKNEQVKKFEMPEDQNCELLWSPDGRTLAAIFMGHIIRLYEPMTGHLASITIRKRHFLTGATFSPDSKLFAFCGYNDAVTLWDLETGQMIGKRSFHKPRNLHFSADGKALSMNYGRVDVRSFYPGQESLRDYEFLVKDDWVIRGGKKVLWLPPDYIPTYIATTDDTLIMAHESGKITFLKFQSREIDSDVEI